MTGGSLLDFYDMARSAIDYKISRMLSKGGYGRDSGSLMAHHLDMPSMMASLITGEDVETDCLVLEYKNEYLVDIGFVNTFPFDAVGRNENHAEIREVVIKACDMAVSFSSKGLPQNVDEELKKKISNILVRLDWRDIFGRANPDISKVHDISPREMMLLKAHMPVYMDWRKRFIEGETRTYVISYSEDFVIPTELAAEPVHSRMPPE